MGAVWHVVRVRQGQDGLQGCGSHSMVCSFAEPRSHPSHPVLLLRPSLPPRLPFPCCRFACPVDTRRGKRQKQEQQQQQTTYTPLPEYIPFRPTKALAFDLFPHTAHVEAVVLFERD